MDRLTNALKNLAVGLLFATMLAASGIAPTLAQNDAASPTPDASPTSAAELPAFALYPQGFGPHTSFNVTLKPGETGTFTVDLVNSSSKTFGKFKGRTFAANVSVRTNGGIQTSDSTEVKSGATIWLDYPTDIVTLDPGTGIARTFTVTVPKDAKPGQYFSALCFETAKPIAIEGTPNLKQNLRSTIAFEINVPGTAAPSFALSDVRIISDDTWTGIQATIANTGNILVRPSGTITISDLEKKPLISFDISLGEFFAFKNGLLQFGLGGLVPAGKYLVTIDLHDTDSAASATIENQLVDVMTSAQVADANASLITFGQSTGNLKPTADRPQFLNVSATVTNSGDPVSGAELDIAAYKDGKLVETYVLVSPLALPKGDTIVSSRYIPANGFSKGSWSFNLSVQVRDPQSGIARVLNTVTLGDPVAIP